MRASAITCSAQFSCLSPPRLSRCRCCFPLEASTGLVPARAAKDASLAIRFGSPLETSSCAAQTGPTPGPPTSDRGVDQIALATTAIPPTRALGLPNGNASKLEKTSQPSAIAAAALNSERRHPKPPRPAEQISVTGFRRCDLTTTELDAKHIERHRYTQTLVRVDTDCDRPLHPLTSCPSTWSTGLDRAVSGKGRTLLSAHRPVERSDGGRQVAPKAARLRQHGKGSSRRRPALSAAPRTEQPQTTLHRPVSRRLPWTATRCGRSPPCEGRRSISLKRQVLRTRRPTGLDWVTLARRCVEVKRAREIASPSCVRLHRRRELL